ncbi:MAG: hypothetical protein DRJ35_03790 [Thermoprotei archaeon]|nr:MAG: hypothetical protein DRJ35_03790 [Thermoprotei archaeon]
MSEKTIKIESECKEKSKVLTDIIGKLGRKFVFVADGGDITVPCELIDSCFGDMTVAVFVFSRVSGIENVVIGVDPGRSNIGVVVLLDQYIVYKGVFRKEGCLLKGAILLKKYFSNIIIFVGDTPLARSLINELKTHNFKVVKVPENLPKFHIDYSSSRQHKSNTKHVYDALRIALYGLYLYEQGQLQSFD